MSGELPEHNFGFLLHDAARLLRRRFEERGRSFGLTRAQWQVLAYLAKSDGLRQGALAELLEVRPISLGRQIDRLERGGLVRREAHPTDRRARLLWLTPAAQPILDEMRRIGAEVREQALSGVPPVHRDLLLGLLTEVRANLSRLRGACHD